VSTFKALDRPLAGQKPADEIEAMIGSLWAFAKPDAR
jgi:hypothetical protein